ncbi:MAG: hypothetical protein JWQ27_2710 [Ferruginibacter sp.]|nr:hypothetical protein [Ferruginibacter sp.]
MPAETPLTLSLKDMAFILRSSKSTAYRMRRMIRQKAGRIPYELITLEEFCLHTRLSEQHVLARLKENK